LKSLDIINCEMNNEAASGLSRCSKLKHRGIGWSGGINDVIRVIGLNLSSFEVSDAAAATWLGVAENCHNLENLVLNGKGLMDRVMVESLNDCLKDRMKRLSSMKVNSVPVRLGTDWKGYYHHE
jgi:hypothetical protein